ncbi:Protocadherin-1 [Bulinus truncatus]|nr:Protocadherin-1 [Bulinus truncatus]
MLLGACLCYVVTMVMSNSIDVSLDEELPVGHVVVRLTDYKSVVYNGLEPKQVNLAILDQNTAPANYFKLDQSSGVISVARTIDREDVCDRTDVCKLRLNVAVQSLTKGQQPFSNVLNIQIFINDINDNSPTFPAKDVTLDISEGAKVGTEIKISGAVDRDTKPEFTVQHYNISPPLDEFSIRATSNIDGSSTINLRLEAELDREMTDLYMFNIVAYDGGPSPRSDFIKVKVRVTDDNDNSPVFAMSVYNMTVNETDSPGTVIGQVKATDKDTGHYGEIKYSLSQASELVNKGTFAVHPTNGQISLIGDLRKFRKFGSPFVLYVDAKDGGEPPRSSQTMISILIRNTGNEPPSVKINTVMAGDAGALIIPETAAMNWFVAYVDVEDNDDGGAGTVDCRLLTGREFKLGSLSGRGYTILLNVQLDREVKDSYRVVVSCQDRGNPPLETQVTLTVNVTDVNDNAPVFDKMRYDSSVDENRKDQYVLKVNARDADAGANADITYSLSEQVFGYLKIHPKSGIITTSAELDREKNSSLQLTVYAADSGETAKTGSADVTIYIRDANDNSPVFNRTKFEFLASELTPNNTVIGELYAVDLDIGLNGRFDFYFGGAANKDTPLPVEVLRNGSLVITAGLDRELRESYSFLAVVRDRGEPPRSSSVPVEVKILDENDNDPVILFPTSSNHTIVISNTPDNNIVLGQIIAFDADQGANGDLRYTIYAGNSDGAFSVGSTTGELLLQDRDRLTNPSVYNLSILVGDVSPSPRNTTTHLRIEVSFENTTGVLDKHASPVASHYILIVGIIGGATFVLSVIIISAILFILHSEGVKRNSNDVSLFQNKFCTGATQAVSSEKLSNDLTLKTPNSNNNNGNNSSSSSNRDGSNRDSSHSSSGKDDPHGPHLVGNEKQGGNEVQKKVSFSLNIEDDQHCWVKRPCPDKTIIWEMDEVVENQRAANSADDSDASLDSAPSDSGKGTSDEDIKFDSYLATRGQRRPLYQSSQQNAVQHRGDLYDYTKFSAPHRVSPQSTPALFNFTAPPSHHHHLPHLSPVKRASSLQTAPHLSCATAHVQAGSGGECLSSPLANHYNDRTFPYDSPLAVASPLQSFSRPHFTTDDDESSTSGSYIVNHEDASFDKLVVKDLVV